MARSDASMRVAVVVFDHFPPFELAVAVEAFGIDRSVMGVPRCEVRIAAADPTPLAAKAGGFTLDTPHGLEAVAWADLVVVPGWDDVDRRPAPAVLDALRAARRRRARLASFCSGAFVLAHAGLLDGRRATTHWMYADALARRFPAVDVRPDVLYIEDDGIFTSA